MGVPRILILYGSTTGSTARAARLLAKLLDLPAGAVHDLSRLSPATLEALVAAHDVLLLGCPTYGWGDLQDHWYRALETLQALPLAGKTAALFGCGDSVGFPETFCAALKLLHEALSPTGLHFVGALPGLSPDPQPGTAPESFPGLALDPMNHPGLTLPRLTQWVTQLRREIPGL